MKRDFNRLLQKIPANIAPYFIMLFLMALTLFGGMVLHSIGYAILKALKDGN